MLSRLPVQLAMLCLLRHGRTQTAVSVPMQIGAAFAVLQAQGETAAPLELQAAKSRLLHLEPAAGAAGLGMLTARLQQQPSHETLHLRAVNPHVAAIFQVSLQTGRSRCSCHHTRLLSTKNKHALCCRQP